MFFDTETNGKPANYKAPMTQVDNWPRVIQLAWSLTNLENTELTWGNYLIKPDGWEIPCEATHGKDAEFWIKHGFDTLKSLEFGVPIHDACYGFIADLQSCDVLVAHNMAFDYNVLGAEMVRLGLRSDRVPARICTMEQTTNFCKIPYAGRRDTRPWVKQSYKWPKLEELHRKLFGKDFDNAHDAGGDVSALRSCFFELVRRKVITLDQLTATQRNVK
jgi:DNA polymerase-3 subunit epsilon